VLLTIGQPGAAVGGEPVERIAVEMVWRAVSHDSHAVPCGAADALGRFLAEPATRLGLVKRWRKPPRERQQLEYLLWGEPSGETGESGPHCAK